jgi:hypothetical protein
MLPELKSLSLQSNLYGDAGLYLLADLIKITDMGLEILHLG